MMQTLRHLLSIQLFLCAWVHNTNLLGQTNIEATEVAPGIHRLFVDNRVAVILMTGDEASVLIDTAFAHTAEDLKHRVYEMADQPLRFVINTHIHGDHTGGNAVLGKNAFIIAHENVRTFLEAQHDEDANALSLHALPQLTFQNAMKLHLNKQDIELIHLPGGHTDGDIIVHFPERKVLVLGDLLFAGFFPFVDINNGGNPFKYLEHIDWILEHFPKDTVLIGGHGPAYSMDQYREWLQSLRQTIQRIAEVKEAGMSAEQMKTERILEAWSSFGTFFISEDRWIDTLYPFL